MPLGDLNRSLNRPLHRFPTLDMGAADTLRPRTQGFLNERVALDLFIVFELALIVVAGLVARQTYLIGYLKTSAELVNYLPPLMAIVAISFLVFRARGLYGRFAIRNIVDSMVGVAAGLVLSFGLLIVLGYLLGVADYYSRMWVLLWLLGSVALVLPARGAATSVFRSWASKGHFTRRVAIVGDPLMCRAVQAALAVTDTMTEVVATIDVADLLDEIHQGNDGSDGATGPSGGRLTALDNLLAQGHADRIDRVLIAAPRISPDDLELLLEKLSALAAGISLVRNDIAPRMPVQSVRQSGQLTLLDVQRRAITDYGVLLKTVEDYVLGAIASIVFMPVMVLCALAVKMESRGPVFFLQRRHGYDHQIITVWKFRTMKVQEDGDVVRQATKDDDRVTRVGRFLRKTSLDELPQLINVMRGEMSLVGPRPHAVAHNVMYERLLNRYANRHRVKPGITGWAQVNGLRGPTEDPELMRQRVEHDLHYIENWSIWLDIKILIATPFYGFIGKNAF